ncbi:hypothetical protein BH10PSE17_BH10PSE17_18810 [soil metagenome]
MIEPSTLRELNSSRRYAISMTVLTLACAVLSLQLEDGEIAIGMAGFTAAVCWVRYLRVRAVVVADLRWLRGDDDDDGTADDARMKRMF